MSFNMLAALFLALLSGFDVARAARLGTGSEVGVVDSGVGDTSLRHLHDVSPDDAIPEPERETEEVSVDVTKRVFRGFLLQRTASCPTGMTLAEVVECSSTSSKFKKAKEENKVVNGDVVGFTCGCVACLHLSSHHRCKLVVTGCRTCAHLNCELHPHPAVPHSRALVVVYSALDHAIEGRHVDSCCGGARPDYDASWRPPLSLPDVV